MDQKVAPDQRSKVDAEAAPIGEPAENKQLAELSAAGSAVCKGMNCTSTTGKNHSPQCEAEHAAACAGGEFKPWGEEFKRSGTAGYGLWFSQEQRKESMLLHSKTYPDGTQATGAAPLPEGSPVDSAGGWIMWNGGKCPVKKGTLVDVRFRNGFELRSVPAETKLPGLYEANGSYWDCDDMPNDIIAYRVVQQPAVEAEIVAKGLTAPRVTPADIEANIVSAVYFTAFDGFQGSDATEDESLATCDALRLLTFCVLVLRNGFTVTGESACASPENFDAETGRKRARQNAVQKIWPLMGYALRERLAQGGA